MLGVRRWRESWWQIGQNGRTLFDRPKPTVGCSANGRRRRRRRGRRRIIRRSSLSHGSPVCLIIFIHTGTYTKFLQNYQLSKNKHNPSACNYLLTYLLPNLLTYVLTYLLLTYLLTYVLTYLLTYLLNYLLLTYLLYGAESFLRS